MRAGAQTAPRYLADMPSLNQRFGLRRPTPLVLATLVVLVSLYIVSALAMRFSATGAEAAAMLVLQPAELFAHGRVWTLATYALLHDTSNPFHLIFNCMMIGVFGPVFEERWGTKRLAIFMAATVVTGGLFVLGAYLLHLGGAAALGASAFALGLVVAWGFTFPDADASFFLIPVKGSALVYISVGFAVLDAVSTSATSAAAHFGGMAAAAVLVRGLWRANDRVLWWDQLLVKLRIRKPARLSIVPKGPEKYIQ